MLMTSFYRNFDVNVGMSYIHAIFFLHVNICIYCLHVNMFFVFFVLILYVLFIRMHVFSLPCPINVN